MSIKHLPRRLAALALLAGLLAGCTASAPHFDLSSLWHAPAQEPPAPALEVFAWHASPDDDAQLQTLIAAVGELNPGVIITLTIAPDYEASLAEALASPTPPDIFLTTGDALPELAAAGIVAPIAPAWLDPRRYQPAALAGVSLAGQPYCFPHSLHTFALAYNPALFDRFELALPDQTWTWQELSAAAEAATDHDNGLYGLVLAPDLVRWLPFYLQAGGALPAPAPGAPRFDEGAARQASDLIAGLFAAGYAVEPLDLESSWAGEAFGKGRAAMTIEGSWLLPFLADAFPDFDYGLTDLPAGPADEANVALVTCLAVNQTSPHRDLALQLAVQLAAPEVLPQWTGDGRDMPVFAAEGQAWLSNHPQALPFYRGMDGAEIWRFGPNTRSSLESFTAALRLVAEEELEPAEFWPYLLRNGAFASTGGEPEAVPIP